MEKHVGTRDKAVEHVDRFCLLQIKRQRFLRAIDPHEVAGHAFDGRVVPAGEVADTRSLDLDDAGTEISKLAAGKRCSHGLLNGDDGDVLERQHYNGAGNSECRMQNADRA